jgi:integrase
MTSPAFQREHLFVAPNSRCLLTWHDESSRTVRLAIDTERDAEFLSRAANNPLRKQPQSTVTKRVVLGEATHLSLDPGVTVHSLRVAALTTARERGPDIIDLQDFAGHADPRTTLTYIRSRDRLSKSPAYILNY